MIRRAVILALIPFALIATAEEAPKGPAVSKVGANPLDVPNQSGREEILKWADDWIATKPPQHAGIDPFQIPRDKFQLLLFFDLPKAVALFAEAENRFTENLSHGGSLYLDTMWKFPQIRRDEALHELIGDDESILLRNPVASLRFLKLLQESPNGGRFSYGWWNPYNVGTVMRFCGESVQLSYQDSGKKFRGEMWAAELQYAATLDEDVRLDALMSNAFASSCYGYVPGDAAATASLKRNMEEFREPLKENFRFLQLVMGLNIWPADTAEGHQATANAVASLLTDPAIRRPLKEQLAFVAIIRAPALLDDPDVAPLLADAYEIYCSEDRSAVNPSSAKLFEMLSKAEFTHTGTKILRRFHEAFWQNVETPKAAGHLPIPEMMIPALAVVAGRAGDAKRADRVKVKGDDALKGNFHAIIMLVASGQYAAAIDLMPSATTPYTGSDKADVFTRKLEERLPEFLAKVDDPQQELRFQIQLLVCKDGQGADAPVRPFTVRAASLAEEYRSHPAGDHRIQMEMLRQLTLSNQLNALTLYDEITAWAKDCNLKTDILLGCTNGDEIIDGLNRRAYAIHVNELMQAAALSGLLRGNTSMLEKITDAMVGAPPVLDNPEEMQTMLWKCQEPFLQRSAIWIWLGISRNETSAFERSLDSFEALTLNLDNRKEFHLYEIQSHLAVFKFLSCWAGKPERYDALVAKLSRPAEQKRTSYPVTGLASLGDIASISGTWKSPYFAEVRKKAMAREYSDPAHASWERLDEKTLSLLTASVPNDEIAEVGAMPIEKIVPEARGGLLYVRANILRKQKQMEEAIRVYHQSIDACQGPALDEMRGLAKFSLGYCLVDADRMDEARDVIKSMTAEEVIPRFRTDHRSFLSKLGVKLPPPAK